MVFSLDRCRIDCDRRELHRDGALTHVEPQVFDVLVHLVRHRDRVVSKEELLRNVWSGRFVSDDTLTSRVSEGEPSAPRKPRPLLSVLRYATACRASSSA